MTTFAFEQTSRGYANIWARAALLPARRTAALAVARRLNVNRARYQAAAVGTMPWWWVAAVHELEAGQNFTRHLHNGDPLTARTRHVPAGRPIAGKPPFTWEESARDALTMKGLDKVTAWPVERACFEWERYNGFGYVAHAVNSPYVWSFTNQYSRGKYVADGKFDASAVSQQCGAAATLRAMGELGYVDLGRPTLAGTPVVPMSAPVPTPPLPTPRPGEPNFLWAIIKSIWSLFKR